METHFCNSIWACDLNVPLDGRRNCSVNSNQIWVINERSLIHAYISRYDCILPARLIVFYLNIPWLFFLIFNWFFFFFWIFLFSLIHFVRSVCVCAFSVCVRVWNTVDTPRVFFVKCQSTHIIAHQLPGARHFLSLRGSRIGYHETSAKKSIHRQTSERKVSPTNDT